MLREMKEDVQDLWASTSPVERTILVLIAPFYLLCWFLGWLLSVD